MASSENMPTAGNNNVNGLLTLNNLSYTLPNDLSVSISRTGTSQYFQAKTYNPSQNMICVLNTGASYVNPERSYLRIDLTNTSIDSVSFGGGTACNLFDRLLVSSRDGSVLERIDNLNLLCRIRQNYEHDLTYFHTVLSAAGGRYNGTTEAATSNVFIQPGQTVRFCIPMSMISPMFASRQLLPNSLASGLRFDLQLATGARAFQKKTQSASTSPLSYTITDCAIICESYQLSDLVLRNLNQMSSSSGLEYVYDSWFNTSGRRNQNSINIESRKAVSRALACVYVETEQESEDDGFIDCFKSIPPAFLDIQARVGSLYLPTQSSLRASSPSILAPEVYAQTLLAFEKFRDRKGVAAASLTDFENGASVFASSLERDTLGGAGIPLSNSRTLAIDGTFAAPQTGESFAVSFFLKYTSLARIYLSNIVLET
jgi:hypothetical protein